MRLVDLEDQEINKFLQITDLENFFDIAVDFNNNYVFNFNKGLYIKVQKSALPEFECKHEMHWTLISYMIYGTTRLAWLLWKLNDVGMADVFKAKQPHDKVKYLPTKYLESLVSDINMESN